VSHEVQANKLRRGAAHVTLVLEDVTTYKSVDSISRFPCVPMEDEGGESELSLSKAHAAQEPAQIEAYEHLQIVMSTL